MGANMVRRLLKGGHQCVVFDTSAKAVTELTQLKVIGSSSLAEFAQKLSKPRTVWLMVPAAAVDKTIAAVLPHLERDDILIDGGNSYYVDDIRRAKELSSSVRPDVAVILFQAKFVQDAKEAPALDRAMIMVAAKQADGWRIAAGQVTKQHEGP
jgi:6-phosphogluconate dehydrogenase